MATVSTSIRFNKELLKRGKEEADFQGITFNALVTSLLAEKLQDIEDYEDALKASKEGGKTYSREEIKEKYSL